MSKKFVILSLISVFLFSSCAKKFISPAFEQKTFDHKMVAVAPFQMVYSGSVPKNLTAQDLEKINILESKGFQASLANALLNKSGNGKKDIKIEFQPVNKTLSILDSNGITVNQASAMSPEALCKLLRVDAIVMTRVEKTRYMSDLASLGIDVGQDVLNTLGGIFGEVNNYVPVDLNKTYDITTDCSLYNGKDGSLLWKISVLRQIDYTMTANEVVTILNNKLARNFPYRNHTITP